MYLSACAYQHMQSVERARTMADLYPATEGSRYWNGGTDIQMAHVAEAIQYQTRLWMQKR